MSLAYVIAAMSTVYLPLIVFVVVVVVVVYY